MKLSRATLAPTIPPIILSLQLLLQLFAALTSAATLDADELSVPQIAITCLAGSADAGSVDGTGVARFDFPYAMAINKAGDLFVADSNNQTIRKISSDGAVTTFAGSAGVFGSNDGKGELANFSSPQGVAVDQGGNVYVADTNNQTIRKITPDGVVKTLAGTAGINGSAVGAGGAAQFDLPAGVAVDESGNVYVADANNQTIQKITQGGVVTTLAGSVGIHGSADGVGSAAQFSNPQGLAVDRAGNICVADTNNQTIRKISSSGQVTTLAGAVETVGSTDGPGGAARFNYPFNLTVDAAGNIYVADVWNSTIRKITSAGMVTTLAGTAGKFGSEDGLGTAALFCGPRSVAVDQTGNIFVADAGNNAIRRGVAALAILIIAPSNAIISFVID